jgi:hypothetical protein
VQVTLAVLLQQQLPLVLSLADIADRVKQQMIQTIFVITALAILWIQLPRVTPTANKGY